jgi:hypothetical protein
MSLAVAWQSGIDLEIEQRDHQGTKQENAHLRAMLKDLTRILDWEGEAKHVLFTTPMCCFFDCGSAY